MPSHGDRQTDNTSNIPSLVESISGIAVDGILLHGSTARTQNDSFSDTDVLVLVREPGLFSNYYRFGSTSIDLKAGTYGELLEQMRLDYPDNNNRLLQAFRDGVILKDQNGHLQQLLHEAYILFKRGPRQLNEAERSEMRLLMKATLTSASVGVRREIANPSPTNKGLAEQALAMSFLNILTVYHRLHRLWRNGIRIMLHEYGGSTLGTLMRSFIEASSHKEKLKALSMMGDLCLEETSDLAESLRFKAPSFQGLQ